VITNGVNIIQPGIVLLSTRINPTTLALVHYLAGLEQIGWFKRDDVSGALKFL